MYISISCITAFYGFRPYGGSLLSNSHKSKQKVLALPYGRARLGSPGAFTPALLWGHAATGHPWPDRGWLGVLPRHPHNSTCVQPPVMGPSVVPTVSVAAGILFLKLKAKGWARCSTTPAAVAEASSVTDSLGSLELSANQNPQPVISLCSNGI